MTEAVRRGILVAASILLCLAGATTAHYAIAVGSSPTLGAAVALLPFVIVAIALAGRSRRRWLWIAIVPALGIVAWSAWDLLEDLFPSVYFLQHVGSNLLLGAMFARTLAGAREPLCTRFARMTHGTLPDAVKRYTRRVTIAWVVFFLAMAAISSMLYFSGHFAAWSVLANFLTLPAVAAMFAGEFLVRRQALPGWTGSILDGVRVFLRHSASARFEAQR